MKVIVSICVLCVLVPATANSQATDCPAVTGRVSAGAASVDDLVLTLECPAERAAALASWVSIRKAETDTSLLREAYWAVNGVRSPLTFEALMSIAADPGASAQARVFSLWSLLFVEHGSASLDYTDMATLPLGELCTAGSSPAWEATVDTDAPIPADHRQRVIALASDVVRDLAAPPQVQSAAWCLATTLVDDLTLLPPPGGIAVGPPLPAQKLPGNITLGYICEDRYYIRNANPGTDTVTVKYKGTPMQYDVVLAGPVPGLPYAETSFHSLKPDKTVELYYHGQRIASARARTVTACPD